MLAPASVSHDNQTERQTAHVERAVESPAELAASTAAPLTAPLSPSRVLALQRTAGNAAVARMVAEANRAQPVVVTRAPGAQLQRYQAGGSGHGGIEEPALKRAGLTADEAHSAYAGNWLRDLSQLPKSPA